MPNIKFDFNLHGIVKDVRAILQNTKECVYIPDLTLEANK
jgi:hypothetical protein